MIAVAAATITSTTAIRSATSSEAALAAEAHCHPRGCRVQPIAIVTYRPHRHSHRHPRHHPCYRPHHHSRRHLRLHHRAPCACSTHSRSAKDVAVDMCGQRVRKYPSRRCSSTANKRRAEKKKIGLWARYAAVVITPGLTPDLKGGEIRLVFAAPKEPCTTKTRQNSADQIVGPLCRWARMCALYVRPRRSERDGDFRVALRRRRRLLAAANLATVRVRQLYATVHRAQTPGVAASRTSLSLRYPIRQPLQHRITRSRPAKCILADAHACSVFGRRKARSFGAPWRHLPRCRLSREQLPGAGEGTAEDC